MAIDSHGVTCASPKDSARRAAVVLCSAIRLVSDDFRGITHGHKPMVLSCLGIEQ